MTAVLFSCKTWHTHVGIATFEVNTRVGNYSGCTCGVDLTVYRKQSLNKIKYSIDILQLALLESGPFYKYLKLIKSLRQV